jgi:hypothetical protein
MDVERTMEFILEQQAKFWAGLQGMREQQAALQQEQADLRSLVARPLGPPDGLAAQCRRMTST